MDGLSDNIINELSSETINPIPSCSANPLISTVTTLLIIWFVWNIGLLLVGESKNGSVPVYWNSSLTKLKILPDVPTILLFLLLPHVETLEHEIETA